MKQIDEKVLQEIFDIIVDHFALLDKEWLSDNSSMYLSRYLVGARYALCIIFSLDYDSCHLIEEFFEQKTNEYFGGNESE